MAYSYQVYSGPSVTSNSFAVTQIDGYLQLGHLKVYKNDVLQAAGYTFTTPSGVLTLSFSTAPVATDIIVVRRETPKTEATRVVDFSDGSVLTANDLDRSAIQLLYIAQEAQDTGNGSIGPTLDEQNWDADGKRITNVGLPIDSNDAVTKQYIDGVTLYGQGYLGTPQAWSFTGNGTATTFIFSPVALSTDPNFFIVEVGGVLQRPMTDYDVYGSYIQFVSAPPASVGIRVRNIGITRNVAAFNNPIVFNAGAQFQSTAIFSQAVTFNGAVAVGAGVTLPGATPIGGIIMWSGSIASIPANWALCNGSNGTPNLQDKFIVGAGNTYAVAATGGSPNAVVVDHTHAAGTLTAADAGSHNHQFRGYDSNAEGGGGATNIEFVNTWVETGWTRGTGNVSTVGNHTHSISGSVANPVGGVSGVNANLPPYYALAYIMRIA